MNESGRLHTISAVILLAAISFGVYSVTLGYGFVYDDRSQVLENPWIRDLSHIPEILASSGTSFQNKAANTFRPLLHLVFMAEYRAFGFNAWGWHLVNVVLHALNAIAVFFLASALLSANGRETLSRRMGAYGPGGSITAVAPPFFAGLLFALHPVNAEVVSWVSAVPELTFSLFLFASFLLFLKTDTGLEPLSLLSLAFFFMALTGKETAMSLVFIVFAFEYTRSGLSVAFRRSAPYLFVAVLYMALRTYAVGGVMHHKQAALSAYEAALNALPLVLKYFGKLIWPSGLNALYEFHPALGPLDTAVIGGAVVVLLFILAVILARRSAVVLTGLVMMAAPLLPVLYIPALSSAPFADRYMYLPSAGLAIIFAAAMKRVFSIPEGAVAARAAVLAAALAISAVYSYVSASRSAVWKDDYTLWADTVKKSPNSSNVHYNLAWASQDIGDTKTAVEHYREAARLDPARSADAHYNLGVILSRERMFEAAATEFREALKADPGYTDAAQRLTILERRLGAGEK